MRPVMISAFLIMLTILSCGTLDVSPDVAVKLSAGISMEPGAGGGAVYVYGPQGDLVFSSNGAENYTMMLKNNMTYSCVACSGIAHEIGKTASAKYLDTLTVDLRGVSSDSDHMPRAATSVFGVDDSFIQLSMEMIPLLARICLMDVHSSLPATFGTFRLLDAYISNAPMRSTLRNDTSCITNAGGVLSPDCPEVLFRPIGADMAYGETLPLSRNFYCFPPSEPGMPPMRLVLRTEIGGETYYYPVTLDALKPGVSYSVRVNVKNLGAGDPDTPVDCAEIKVMGQLGGWSEPQNIITIFN